MHDFPHLGMRIAYDGANRSGFQRQSKGRSLQADLERALSVYFRRSVRLEFSSRTDAGVHALDQWGMVRGGREFFDLLSAKAKRSFLISLNAILPPEIRIWSVFALRSDVRLKSAPRWKEYEYRVLSAPSSDPLWQSRALWFYSGLKVSEMQRAFKSFEGEHNFAAYATQASRYGGKTTRMVLRAAIVRRKHERIHCAEWLIFRVRARGFLQHMVRTMVGTVLEVGLGRRPADFIQESLRENLTRRMTGVNAPPHPLVLVKTHVPRHLICQI